MRIPLACGSRLSVLLVCLLAATEPAPAVAAEPGPPPAAFPGAPALVRIFHTGFGRVEQVVVAQAACLLGRRLPSRQPVRSFQRPAGWKPAIQQVGNLRYEKEREISGPDDPDFFPIGVWLQNPSRAARYRAAGFNLYVGLWKGPTEAQLATLKAAGMRVICRQNEVGLRHRKDPTILGWMHGDEPDNAQRRPDGQGYGPPIPPDRIVADYRRLRAADPTRPVLLNLGQGVAWDGWRGRGVRTGHPEDYPEYARGGDIVSFDIYPACHRSPEVAGKLWYVARGVKRLVGWAGPERQVWNCIECTHIQNPDACATPAQVRAEVWMSLIHGSRGLIYFVHEWKPRFNEAALLDNPAMLAMVTRVNRRITSLAPALNSPSLPDAVTVEATPAPASVAVMVKRAGPVLHVFSVEMRGKPAQATFRLLGVDSASRVEVLDEDRQVPLKAGVFRDTFRPWEVHLYRVSASASSKGNAGLQPAAGPVKQWRLRIENDGHWISDFSRDAITTRKVNQKPKCG